MKIASGALDRKLELITLETVVDDFGQELPSIERLTTIYAQRLEMRTVDLTRAGSRDALALGRFLIRWRPNMTTRMQLRHDGKLFDIVAIDEPDRRATLILTVEERTR